MDDEYKSVATYAQVIADFGPVRPFINLVEGAPNTSQANSTPLVATRFIAGFS